MYFTFSVIFSFLAIPLPDKVVSTHEVTVSTDTMLDKLHADKLDALILPGGAGSWVLRDTPEVIHLVKKMHEAGKLVAAICAAPIVLAKAGLVRDRNVTAYPAQDVYRELNEAGAHIVKDENVVLDGNMLTANGPGAASLVFPGAGSLTAFRMIPESIAGHAAHVVQSPVAQVQQMLALHLHKRLPFGVDRKSVV